MPTMDESFADYQGKLKELRAARKQLVKSTIHHADQEWGMRIFSVEVDSRIDKADTPVKFKSLIKAYLDKYGHKA